MNGVQGLRLEVEKEIPKREIPKDLPSLSVFEYPYTWKSWSGFWHNIVYFFRCWRPAWYRATKGFCRADTWNVDVTTCTYLVKVLTEYRNITCSWPDQDFPTFEEWIAYIDEIIDNLIYSLEDEDKLNKYHDIWWEKCCGKSRSEWTEVENKIWEDYRTEVETIYNKQKSARLKAFTMLGAQLHNIWW